MRIEAYTQVQQIYQSQKTDKSRKETATASADEVQISSFGHDIQTAKAAIAKSPDIREAMTASIKEKVQNGTYEVNVGSFADKLLSKFEETT